MGRGRQRDASEMSIEKEQLAVQVDRVGRGGAERSDPTDGNRRSAIAAVAPGMRARAFLVLYLPLFVHREILVFGLCK